MFQRSHTLWYFIKNSKHFSKFFFLQISCKDLLFLCTSIMIMFFSLLFHRLFPYREWMGWVYYKLDSSKFLKLLVPQLRPTLRPHGLTSAHQALRSMGFSRQDHWSGCHSFLQEIFPTQGLNLGLPHCRQILYHLSHLQQLPTSCFTYCMCFNAPLSIGPASPSPRCVHKSVLYVCTSIPDLQIGSSVPLF